ncbi:isoleucyl-tRNA synthetase [Pedobacter sp. MC2016-14]|uniref:isoleucyl-tRNA synthetase n=1 Tax=Pedobacter sp. MC2016-14 TaxID=2897327 RepID=UPI001E60CBFF|nr:isoleucyl-tRNA synthetase [Pedobacter sp. MC2016-14]MCD0487830.1 isoleucyl-tRNA synthetase [Pedobacter sp. MC2016-14]
MIKVLKLQKAVIAFVLGVLGLIAYKILSAAKNEASIYVLEAAGLCFVIGGLMFMYPILFAKKDKEGLVNLDPEAVVEEEAKD